MRTISIIGCLLVLAGVLYADQKAPIKSVPVVTVPGYLQSAYYDTDGIYEPEVLFYNSSIENARHIIVCKRTYDKGVYNHVFGDKHFFSYGGFIYDNNEDLGKICSKVPLLKRTVKYDRFEFLEYNAEKYIDYIKKDPYSTAFSVVKDRGMVIWYNEGEVPEDIAITNDGRYMIATMYSVFYSYPAAGKIISEMYSGNRHYWSYYPGPKSVRILTDNIIRLEFASGLIEHWQVRLSEEDIQKNMEKYNKEEKWRADKCLLWSNGKKRANKSQAMWCYYESDTEPTYKDTNLAAITAEIPVFTRMVSSSASGNESAAADDTSGIGADEEAVKTGWFARLIAGIKTFFAGLFS
ncbi:MAG: hypothetical protein IJT95_02085 [Abditibacteriota bacterium]|nr:hypothetical protein [Abditibacteriota bacterium]